MAQLYDNALLIAWESVAETLRATEAERDALLRWVREAPHHKTCAGGETTDLSGAYWPHPCTCGRESLIR